MKTEYIGRFPGFLSFFIFFLITTSSFAGSSDERSDPPPPLPDNVLTPSLMGQALINANPRNPEGYKLLAADQTAHFQWLALLRTVKKAEQNGVSDPSLYAQMAMAFLALQKLPENFHALGLAEVSAREHAD